MQFNYKYGGSSQVYSSAVQSGLSFAPDTLREPTFFVGQLHQKLPFREAISALNAVVVSDLRFKPKDKSAYLAWAKEQEELWLAEYISSKVGDVKAMEGQIAELRTRIQEIDKEQNKLMGPFYKARSAYFNYLYEKDRDTWFVLDPVITVHPDSLFFECFSQDESTYGKLSCSHNVFEQISEFACGTTNIDYSEPLYQEFQKIRHYKATEFKVDPSGFEVKTTGEESYKEVKIDLPDSWVRGFLQVSSAMTMPNATSFDLHPMDIHSLCQTLRRHKEDRGPRSLRFDLRPGQPVRVIVEPWNIELVFHRSVYQGDSTQSIRLWGRRRLLTLERLIPISRYFRVTLLGSGMPSFFEAVMDEMVFTLGLSGWTANDWSRAGNFDLLAPRTAVDDYTKKTVFEALKKQFFAASSSLASSLNLDVALVEGALSAYTQAGRVIYDRHLGVYRLRELSREPLDMKLLRFASPQEEKANKLLSAKQVQIEEVLPSAEGRIEIRGTVRDKHYTHKPRLVLDADDRLVEAECDCNFYNMNKLRKGPCEHILALRMLYNQPVGQGI